MKDQQIEGENTLFREPENESLFYLTNQIKKCSVSTYVSYATNYWRWLKDLFDKQKMLINFTKYMQRISYLIYLIQ